MSPPESAKEEFARLVYVYTADLLKQGKAATEVEATLVVQGFDRETASLVVTDLLRLRARVARKVALRGMGIGALVCLVGIIMSVSMASSGGSYWIAWGAIIFGVTQFARGLWYYTRA